MCLTLFLHNLSSTPLCLEPSSSYSIHFFTQSLSYFATHAHTITTCFGVVLRLCHLFLVSLSTLNSAWNSILTSHIHLTILISVCWSATLFSFFTDQVSLPCNILLCTKLLYSLLLLINDISLLVTNGTSCLNLFDPIRILVSRAALASLSKLSVSPKQQNVSTDSQFALAPILILVILVSVKEGPAYCIRIDEVAAALKKMKKQSPRFVRGCSRNDTNHRGYWNSVDTGLM